MLLFRHFPPHPHHQHHHHLRLSQRPPLALLCSSPASGAALWAKPSSCCAVVPAKYSITASRRVRKKIGNIDIVRCVTMIQVKRLGNHHPYKVHSMLLF
jgi:hypothetical protein